MKAKIYLTLFAFSDKLALNAKEVSTGKELGNKLRQLRENQGWVLRELAERLSAMDTSGKVRYKSPSLIYEWEHGIKEPRPEARKLLAKIYGISESELFTYDEPEVNRVCYDMSEASFPSMDMKIRSSMPPPPRKSGVVFNGCAEKVVWDDSLSPFIQKGQKVIYSLNDTQLHENDLVLVRLNNGKEFIRRYSTLPDKGMIIFSSVSESQSPIVVSQNDISYCYRIVGIKF